MNQSFTLSGGVKPLYEAPTAEMFEVKIERNMLATGDKETESSTESLGEETGWGDSIWSS